MSPVDTPRAAHVPDLLSIGVAFALAAACFFHFGVTARAFISALFVVALVVLSVIDIEQGLLPNRIVLPATLVVLILQLAFFPGHALEWILSSVGAAAFFLIAYLSYRAGLGLGDVKLALLLGAGLGKGVVLGIFLGMFAAGIGGLVVIARNGLEARKQTIPLGPFLAFGACISLFFHGSNFVSF
ncbi:MAG: leader peptidase (prepilin peptidase) / N-methyltransferase [Gaiellaceae bacterium]|jgi:leader peptidase (prepilin peptidase)/N-methyltransferase|nr:leader peptidase (prepilin peptidase) / N-methyltransferase [Gaiellaceae bacterium]